jgi:hypothetical protein
MKTKKEKLNGLGPIPDQGVWCLVGIDLVGGGCCMPTWSARTKRRTAQGGYFGAAQISFHLFFIFSSFFFFSFILFLFTILKSKYF